MWVNNLRSDFLDIDVGQHLFGLLNNNYYFSNFT